MLTIVTNITTEEMAKIKAGRNFIVHRTKVAPVEGQPLILQTANEEYSTVIELVHNEPGLMKDYYILAWMVSIAAPTLERQ